MARTPLRSWPVRGLNDAIPTHRGGHRPHLRPLPEALQLVLDFVEGDCVGGEVGHECVVAEVGLESLIDLRQHRLVALDQSAQTLLPLFIALRDVEVEILP